MREMGFHNIHEVVRLVKDTPIHRRYAGAVKCSRRAFISTLVSVRERIQWAVETTGRHLGTLKRLWNVGSSSHSSWPV